MYKVWHMKGKKTKRFYCIIQVFIPVISRNNHQSVCQICPVYYVDTSMLKCTMEKWRENFPELSRSPYISSQQCLRHRCFRLNLKKDFQLFSRCMEYIWGKKTKLRIMMYMYQSIRLIYTWMILKCVDEIPRTGYNESKERHH